ncbi:MAG: TRAP transporter TatT component family protein [Acidobacteriota bacterium]
MSRWPHVLMLLALVSTGCSLKTYAINMVGNALASGNSVYETDDDLGLVGAALPFGLKLTESLLAQSPDHPGLLLTACRGFVLYGYGYVHHAAVLDAETDLDLARLGRDRARRLYLRAFGYCVRGMERWYPGFGQALSADARGLAARITPKTAARDVPWLYWTAASLGLAVSAARDDAAMLARLPDVQALLDRALALDESWDEGALHEFSIVVAAAAPGAPNVARIRQHYDRAVALSAGKSAGVHVAYAEAVSIPQQNGAEFRAMLEKALAVNSDLTPANRLVNLFAHRRARWLAAHADELILGDPPARR